MTGSRVAAPGERDAIQQRLMQAATAEFAARGLEGARLDDIARQAGVGKRAIYQAFGNKAGLYVAVLERIYAHRRQSEHHLALEVLEPKQAIATFVRFNFDYCAAHPEFIALINHENLYGALHLTQSRAIKALHLPLIQRLADILARGLSGGAFRRKVDPVDLYVTVASLNFFYFSNRWTLSAVFGRDFDSIAARDARRRQITDVILAYLTSAPEEA